MLQTLSRKLRHDKYRIAGLLGNIGCKNDEQDWYLGARGIKFYRHPGAHLRKKPGRWVVCAELVETTRLFGRAIATIEPQWLEEVGGHLQGAGQSAVVAQSK